MLKDKKSIWKLIKSIIKYYLITLAVIFSLMVGSIVIHIFGKITYSIIERNFEMILCKNLVVICIIFIFIVLLFFGISYILRIIFNKYIEPWFVLTILFMIFSIVIGLEVIDFELGNRDIIYHLSGDSSEYSLICHSWHNTGLMSQSKLTCTIDPELEVMNGTVILQYSDNTTHERNYFDEILMGDPNLNTIKFNITTISYTNETFRLSTGEHISHISSEERFRWRTSFLTYIFALFGITFFSIPTMMIHLRNLWNGNQHVVNSKRTTSKQSTYKKA